MRDKCTARQVQSERGARDKCKVSVVRVTSAK